MLPPPKVVSKLATTDFHPTEGAVLTHDQMVSSLTTRASAVNRAADGSGWPHAYQTMPGTADAAFCLAQYDGAEHFVRCTVRDSNVVLELSATWNDPSSALRRATVEQALATFAPRAQRLLTGVVDRL